MRTTQRQNILRHLLAGPLCGVHDGWELGRRFAARIHELRAVGFLIETPACDMHGHSTYQIMYQLHLLIRNPATDMVKYWCAHCGPQGRLRFIAYQLGDDYWPSQMHGHSLVQCDRCGKRDYR